MKKYDVIVIGAGNGGLAAAANTAKAKAAQELKRVRQLLRAS